LKAVWAALALLLVVAPVTAQRPILEVQLDGVGAVLVEGRLTPAGQLELPVAPIEELTGATIGEAEFLSIDALSRALGTPVTVDYDPRRALLALRDPARILPATQARFARIIASSRVTPGIISGRGPFSAITASSGGDRSVEAGWNFGRLALNVVHSTLSGSRWGVAVQPIPQAWLSYEDAVDRGGSVALRWASGRTFSRVAYSADDQDVRAQLGASAGPWIVYLQRDPGEWSGAVTLRAPVDITIGYAMDEFATRISYGRASSPFMLPRVR
jgi:hypothetical protein